MILFLYAVLYAAEIAAAGFAPRAYNRMLEISGNAAARAGMAVVLLAALFHAFDGLRFTACVMSPRAARHEAALQSVAQFVTFAVGIPAAFVICWPSISELFR